MPKYFERKIVLSIFIMGCSISKRVESKDNTHEKKEENNNTLSNTSDNKINSDEKQVELPSKEKICDKCYYTNGKMAYCVSIDKKKYVFDKKGNFKEIIQLSDDEFTKILLDKGMNPDNFTVDTTIYD